MASQTGSLAATGSVTLTKPVTDTLVQLQVSGTYSGSFVIEGSLDGTNFDGLTALRTDTRGFVSGTITPSNDETVIYEVSCAGFSHVRARVTVRNSGTFNFLLNSLSVVGAPAPVLPNSMPATVGQAGSTFTILGGLNLGTVTNGITAFAGGGQGSAVALTSTINRVTTVATAADSVRLPAAVAGAVVFVANAAAANSMNVFPATGESINALSANAAFAMAANTRAAFFCAVNGVWSAVLSA